MRQTMLIADFSRQYAQLTARRVRERNVYCEVVDPKELLESIKEKDPVGVIITGDATADIGEADAITDELFDLRVPVLAIGFGILLVDKIAGEKGLSGTLVTTTDVAPDLDSEEAKQAVGSFLFDICKCTGDWTPASFAKESIAQLKSGLEGKKVICALSGGVDSTVAAVMVHKAIGDNLTCIFVDHGLMRKDEGDQVMGTLKQEFDMNVIRIDAEDRFLAKLKGVTDPEQKRKIIGAEFIEVFAEEAAKHGDAQYLLQGTIYPDVLESGLDGAKNVKSHHNVGGLPDWMTFELVEPVRLLFKDEVRRVGAAIGIPNFIINRQPFPGPGLGVRCLGELTKPKLDLLRECDAIVREELEKSGLAKDMWQYFAVLPNLQSVGVVDGARTYCETVAIRAVRSIDAMTAEYVRIPYDVLDVIVERIVTELPQVNRVVLDITSKPPSTIEWE